MSLAQVFERAGTLGFVHASTLDGRHDVGLAPDTPVPPASVFKVLVAVEAETRMADGRLDPRERVLLPAAGRTTGPAGFSLFRDDIEVSIGDLPVLMLTISDNVCTDTLLDLVGVDAVNALAGHLGLTGTRIGSLLGELIDSLARDAGFDGWAALEAWEATGPDPEEAARVQQAVRGATALSPAAPTVTTARDMTRLLRLVWADEAGPSGACARVRWLMLRQLARQRIALGFGPGVAVAAKSGALMGVLRHEVGAVTFPDEPPYLVAVLTRTDGGGADDRLVDAAIGEAAAAAVGRLRRACGAADEW